MTDLLFDVSLGAVTAFAVAAQLLAIPFLVLVNRSSAERTRRTAGDQPTHGPAG